MRSLPSGRAANHPQPLQVIAYQRSATPAGSSAKFDRQLDSINEWLSMHEHSLVDTLTEVGSGLRAQPRLLALLDRIEAGEADTLLIDDITRLGRSGELVTSIVYRISAAGARLVISNGGVA